MPKISIIVPVYNVEKYIHRCIDSILHQTFKDFELILVDDGSLDNSGKICDEYAKEDDRIKVIHKENGGLSDARNVGLDIAQGEYIAFVDSDDWIEKDMYSILYENIRKYNADISICKTRKIFDSTVDNNITTNNCIILNNEEAFDCLFNNKYYASHACDKLYKKSLFDGIRYPVGKLYEDMFTTYRLFEKANKVVFSDYIGYNYFQRKDGIVNSKFRPEKLDYIRAFNGIFDLGYSKYPKSINSITISYVLANTTLITDICRAGYKDKSIISELIRNIRENLFCFCRYKHISVRTKMQAVLIAINYRIYSFLVLAYDKNRISK